MLLVRLPWGDLVIIFAGAKMSRSIFLLFDPYPRATAEAVIFVFPPCHDARWSQLSAATSRGQWKINMNRVTSRLCHFFVKCVDTLHYLTQTPPKIAGQASQTPFADFFAKNPMAELRHGFDYVSLSLAFLRKSAKGRKGLDRFLRVCVDFAPLCSLRQVFKNVAKDFIRS